MRAGEATAVNLRVAAEPYDPRHPTRAEAVPAWRRAPDVECVAAARAG